MVIFYYLCIMKSGIYKISNNINEKIYIGSAKNIKSRINVHRCCLLKNKHHSKRLQNHVNKYGIDSLIFEVVEFCDILILLEREQFYIDSLNPFFNINKIAGSNLGRKLSIESIEKLKKTRIKNGGWKKGWKHTIEARKKMSDASLGHIISQEQKDKQSIAMKGRKVSEETKIKISNASKGRIANDSTRKLMSERKRGCKNPMFGKKAELHHNFGKKWKCKTPSRAKRVIDKNTGIIYESIYDASRQLNIPLGSFSKYILGYVKKINNFEYYEG